MEVKIAEDLITILLLYSIPDTYENFRIAIESRDDLPTPEMLKIKLLEEYNARKDKQSPQNPTQQAFYSNARKSFQRNVPKVENNIDSTKKKSFQASFKCNYCNFYGHRASECRKKKANEKQKSKNNISAMIAENKKYKAEEKTMCTASEDISRLNKQIFCLDSGASSHMSHNELLFTELQKVSDVNIKLAVDNNIVKAIGRGTIKFNVYQNNEIKTVKLQNVLYVPDLKYNLISVSKVTQNNFTVKFYDKYAKVINSDNETIFTAKREKDLYYVEPIFESVSIVSEIKQWHMRFGHLNESDLKKLQSNNMVKGLSFKPNDSVSDCKVCILGKQTATPLPKKSEYRSSELLNIISSDVCGPMRTKSLGGSYYFATFIDDMSRFVHVAFLKSKDEVKDAFLNFKASVENKLNSKIKILRTDNGLEYMGKDFDDYLKSEGIKRQRSCPYTPSQNGTAERENRTLVSMARCLLIQSKLPQKFWAEAINCAAYIRNRCPTKSLSENKTPYEIFFGRKPNIHHMKIFGQKAFPLDKRLQKGKFDARSKECIFIGYSDESKGYRLWDNETQQVIISRDVKFIDEYENISTYENELEVFFPEDNFQKEEEERFYEIDKEYKEEKSDEETCEEKPDEESCEDEFETNDKFKRGPGRPRKIRSGRPGRPQKEYNKIKIEENEEIQMVEEENISPSLEEALNGSHSEEWKKAMKSEFKALEKNEAWKLVKRPENKNVIGCRWVLRTKLNADGSIMKRKARLVARGYSQQPGIDFEETFSPVARQSSIRTIIAHCAEKDLELYQLDFVMAYVNGDLKEEIYMEQAKGFEDPSKPDYVYSLKKSLYGLKQSGRQWFNKLDEKLKQFGLKSLNSDKCVYQMKTPKGELILIVYVDDLIVGTNDYNLYEQLKNYLSNEFEIKDIGKLHYCLGIEFNQNLNEHFVSMSQEKYIESILKKFKMQDSKPASTPLDPSIKLSKDQCPTTVKEKQEMINFPYRQLIGSLMYLAVSTRPDISFAISHLSQFNENPGKQHWLAAKHVLRYLNGTKNYGLKFHKNGQPLIGYADADWASDLSSRRSYTGYVFKFGGSAITWESRKQQTVALSSTEAEYVSLSECTKETIYLRRFLKELNYDVKCPTLIYCDNQGAQKIMKNSVYHSRTKHIDIRHHFIREVYDRGELDVKYISTNEMAADILTKTLTPAKHANCCKLIGINVM